MGKGMLTEIRRTWILYESGGDDDRSVGGDVLFVDDMVMDPYGRAWLEEEDGGWW